MRSRALLPNANGKERGNYAASPFVRPQANVYAQGARTLKRPEGRARGGSVKMRLGDMWITCISDSDSSKLSF